MKKILYFFRKENSIYFHVPLHVLDKKQINNSMEKGEFMEGGCAPSELQGALKDTVTRLRGKILDGVTKDDLVTLAPINRICLKRAFTLNGKSREYVAVNATSRKKGKLEFGASHLCESFTAESGEKIFRFGDFLSIAAAMAALENKTFSVNPVRVHHQEFADGKLEIDAEKMDLINIFREVTK